jgi:hypothetical protein
MPVLQHDIVNGPVPERITDDSFGRIGLFAGRSGRAVGSPAGALDILILSAAGQPFERSLDGDGGGCPARRGEPAFLAHFDTLGIGADRRHEM